MRRILMLSIFATLLAGLPMADAAAWDRGRIPRAGYYYAPGYFYVAPVNGFAAWNSFNTAQANQSRALRAYRADIYASRGFYYTGPRQPNYYAEAVSQDPFWQWVHCPLARTGMGVCAPSTAGE